MRRTVEQEGWGGHRALGTHLFPPLFLEKKPKREKGFPRDLEVLQIGNTKCYFEHAGFIGISVQDRVQATDRLNCAMSALSLLHSYSLHAVRPKELTEFEVDDQGIAHAHSYTQTSDRTMMMWEPGIVLKEYYTVPKEPVPKPVIDLAFRLGKSMYDCKHRQIFLGVFNGHTLWNQGASVSAFLNNWIAIETYLAVAWRTYLKGLRLPSSVRRRMKNWSVANLLPVLHLEGSIETERFASLEALRIIRNGIIHGGKIPNEEEGEACRDAAFWASREAMRLCNIRYSDFLDEANQHRQL